MNYNKYQGQANRVKKIRKDKANTPFLNRSPHEIQGRQIPLPFTGGQRTLDIYHQFDTADREITWFFYSESGEFLLQFGFGLKDHRYLVYAVHPGLWNQADKVGPYLEAIGESLAGHYPPLNLIHRDNGEVVIEAQEG